MPRRVLIGSPTYDFKLDCRYTNALIQTVQLCTAGGIDIGWRFPPGNAFVHDARNELVAIALREGYDDLIFVDADQDWHPDWVPQLLTYDVDCVGGAVPKKTDDEVKWNVRCAGGIYSFVAHPDYELLTAPDMALGTGFIRYSRRALQLLWDAAAPYRGLGGKEERRMVFESAVVGGELVSEDTFASGKLRELGVLTWLDPAMTCGHFGLKRYSGDFADWLERTHREAVAQGKSPEWSTTLRAA